MPAEFARRAAVNGIPAQFTTFSPASLTANPECAVRPQFQSAVTITRSTCSFNVLGRIRRANADKLARLGLL